MHVFRSSGLLPALILVWGTAGSLAGDAGDAIRARELDVRAAAEAAHGNHDEAARALLDALALDDGTLRVQRLAADGSLQWSTPVATGLDRHERAARELAAAGRAQDALPLLETARMLGAGEDVGKLRRELGGQDLPEPPPLTAARWFPLLPELDVKLLDGTELPLRFEPPRVLILDFWATWCPPCVDELPKLQELWRRERDRGLEIVTINMKEPVAVAQAFATDLGIELPVGRYDGGMRRAFSVENLPTVIVADRAGRVRARWSGYREGIEETIAQTVQDLLDEEIDGPQDEIATVLEGEGRMRVRWSRETRANVDGVSWIDTESGVELRVVTARRWVAYAADGQHLDTFGASFAASTLLGADLEGDGIRDIVGFRRGGISLIRFDREGDEHDLRDAPAPVLGVALLSATSGAAGQTLLATTDGLFRGTVTGGFERVEGFGEVADVIAATADGSAVVIERDGRLIRLDGDEAVEIGGLPGGGARLADVDATGAVVTAPSRAEAVVVGRFFSGRMGVALVVADQLVVLDRETGVVEMRARWPGIGSLSAGDLDGDGVDELIVAAKRRLTVLEAAAGNAEE